MRPILLATSAALLWSSTGLAQDPEGYDGTTVGLQTITVSHYQFDNETNGFDASNPESRDITSDGDGFAVDLFAGLPEVGPLESAYVSARFADGSDDERDVDYNELRVGLGYYFIGRDRPARGFAFGGLAYEEQTFEPSSGAEVKDDGYSLGGGFRAFVTAGGELGATIHWVDLGEFQGFRTAVSLAIELPWRLFFVADWENQSLDRDFETAANDSLEEKYRRVRLGLRKDFGE